VISPLMFDADAVAQADTLVILVPGALTSRKMFAHVESWADRPGYALAFYRFPGMNGMPVNEPLRIDLAAEQIATFANSHPEKRIRLLGYSTGGPISIMAAQQITGDVRVAALSPAVEHAGGVETSLGVARDAVTAFGKARSLRRDVIWRQYFRVLLFGLGTNKVPVLAAPRDGSAPAPKRPLKLPPRKLPGAQSRDLRRWSLPEDYRPQPDRIRLFIGLADPVFSTRQTFEFVNRLGGPDVMVYEGHGHLMYLSNPHVFVDILKWFER